MPQGEDNKIFAPFDKVSSISEQQCSEINIIFNTDHSRALCSFDISYWTYASSNILIYYN